MNELIAVLFSAAIQIGGFEPSKPPVVRHVPVELLREWACKGTRCPIGGWFPGGNTIYIDEALDLEHDGEARGVVVHEAVHYLQQQRDPIKWADRSCEVALTMEQEAYSVQDKYLRKQEGIWKANWMQMRKFSCEGEGS